MFMEMLKVQDERRLLEEEKRREEEARRLEQEEERRRSEAEKRQEEEARRLEQEEERRRSEAEKRREEEARRLEQEEERQAEKRREEEARRLEREEERRHEWEQEMQQRQEKLMELFLRRTEEPKDPTMPRAKLHKFVEESDDIEAFLEGFEATATSGKWPKERWTSQLVTVLSGKGLLAYSKLDAEAKQMYETVKTQVLEAYSVSADVYRLQFLDNTYDRKNPKQWGRWVKLQFDRWLQARDMDAYTLILLERLLQQLPTRLQVRMRELQHKIFDDLMKSICAHESAWIADERSGRTKWQGRSNHPDDKGKEANLKSELSSKRRRN